MQKYTTHILLTFCLIGTAAFLFAQNTQTIFYTTKDGLPSNSIYRTILDNHGFLWIATDNGLARYDGKTFKTYTTAQGLPDNEITDIFIDSSNRIWVSPFRRTTAYYNPVNDRFENEDSDPELKKIELGNTNRGSVLQYGGISFCNNLWDFYIFKNGKVISYKGMIDNKKAKTPEKIIEFSPGKYLVISQDSARVFEQNRFIKSFALTNESFYSEYFNRVLYISSGNTIKKYRVDNAGNLTLILEKKLPFTIRIFCRAGKALAVTTFNRTTYPLDTATLELKDPLLYNIAVRNVLEDKNGSVWISTIDRGLVKIQQKRISSFTIIDKTLNDEITQNFNALLIGDKKIYAGNYYGELIIYDGVYDIKKRSLSPEKNVDGIVRQIIELKDKIYVACQTGSFLID
ncbi:MAG: two-component regulator propeller domain-containing protein, partial [Ferruginibacter sp.]